MLNSTRLSCCLLLAAAISCCPTYAETLYDVVVYGGTSAGVATAVQAKRMGKSTVIVCPDRHLGGPILDR